MTFFLKHSCASSVITNEIRCYSYIRRSFFMSDTEILQAFTLTRPFPKSYWVIPARFLAGEYPSSLLLSEAKEKIDGLLTLDIDTFIDLTLFDHLEPYEPMLRIEAERMKKPYFYNKMGIRDFSIPSRRDMKKILDTIDTALSSGHNIYVHCWGGIGRTGTVVGCYLARHGVTGKAALDEIARMRLVVPSSRISPETDEQRSMVVSWKTGE